MDPFCFENFLCYCIINSTIHLYYINDTKREGGIANIPNENKLKTRKGKVI